MSRKARRVIAVASAALVGAAFFSSPAYATAQWNGSQVTCAPDSQVRISTQVTSGATVHGWTDYNGNYDGVRYPSGAYHTTYTGKRIATPSAATSGSFVSAGAWCS